MSLEDRLPDLLNKEQLEAVTHPGGPLLVVAGAGTGKTRVITHRVAWLVEKGVPPRRIMAITFTNKAAREMQERIWNEVRCPDVWVSTFHSMAARLLRIEGRRLGHSPDFTIYDEDDSRRLVQRILKDMRGGGDYIGASPGYVRSAISRAKNDLLTPEEWRPWNPSDRLVLDVYGQYQETLRERNAMDFDDLLLNLLRLLDGEQEVREKYAGRFLHLLVDEFQDTNLPQYLIAKHLASIHGNLTVTGDPDQSIYSWRGARLGNILGFKDEFEGCKVVRLERNYRSTPSIIGAADALIKNNRQRLDRSLRPVKPDKHPVRVFHFNDDTEEAAGVVERIKRAHEESGRAFSDCAVLMRTNAQTQLLEQECLSNGVPYIVFGGTAFFQRREVKDVIAYLRLLVNPREDGSFRRAVRIPTRGVGEKTLEKLTEKAEANNTGMLDALDEEFLGSTGGKAARGLRDFRALFQELMSGPLNPVGDVAETVVRESGYIEFLERRGEGERVDNVQELINEAVRFDERNPDGDLREFLEMAALLTDQDRDTGKTARSPLFLMTLHSAKGLEFPVIYLVGMVDGKLPHARSLQEGGDDAVEEERRLCYVGMTRAMEELNLTCYVRQTAAYGGQGAHPSQFLDELPAECLEIHDLAKSAASWSRPPSSWHDETADGGHPGNNTADAVERVPSPVPDEPLRVYDTGYSKEAGYGKGDRVLHRVFGVGTVLQVKGDRVVIDFARAGRKRLSMKFADLEKLG